MINVLMAKTSVPKIEMRAAWVKVVRDGFYIYQERCYKGAAT
jgi:hypothetical protein